jgi:hypothetical protein
MPPFDAIRQHCSLSHSPATWGDTVDIDVLRSRVANVLDAQQACRHDAVAAALPRLIRDMHTTPLTVAAELAQRTGEPNAYWFGFGPTNVGVWRMAVKLEAGDYAQDAAVAEQLVPTDSPAAPRCLPGRLRPGSPESERAQQCRLGSAARGADLPAHAPT